jgi:tyrosyl-tRNA synthetase
MAEIKLSIDERVQLIKSIGIECTKEEDLKNLLTKKETPIAYDGFEPSGRMHLAQALIRASNIKKMQKAGVKMILYIAD